jgi:hypothetical protein
MGMSGGTLAVRICAGAKFRLQGLAMWETLIDVFVMRGS